MFDLSFEAADGFAKRGDGPVAVAKGRGLCLDCAAEGLQCFADSGREFFTSDTAFDRMGILEIIDCDVELAQDVADVRLQDQGRTKRGIGSWAGTA